MGVRIEVGDCRNHLRQMPDESIHCVVTSPPYYALRDYGIEGQIGLESQPEEYIAALVGIFREVRRSLIELNPEYAEIAKQRIAADAPLLAEVS